MPIFLRWCGPLVILFVLCVFLKAPDELTVTAFLLSFVGFLVALVRGIIISKETPRNKNKSNSNDIFKL